MGALDRVAEGVAAAVARHRRHETLDRQRVAWLILAAVIVSAVNATIRKVFDTSSNSWLELQWVLFSVVFLLCSPWTLLPTSTSASTS